MNHNPHILNIEDHETDTLLLARFLRRSGYEPVIERAANREALHKAMTGRRWDAVIADYNVPGFDAPEALKAVREYDTQVPFIVISGAVGEERAVELMRAGAADFLLKNELTRLSAVLDREIAEREKREKAAEALRSSEERLRAAQATARLAAFDWNLSACDIQWSATVPSTDFAGGMEFFRWLPYVHSMDRDAFERVLTAASRERKDGEIEFRLIKPSGEVVWILWRATIVGKDEPEQAHCVGIIMDITKRRETEEALRRAEKLAATAELSAAIAHEINNPLQALSNIVSLLTYLTSNEEQANKLARMAEQEVHRVGRITRQMLNFYRDTAEPVPVKVDELLEDALELWLFKAKTEGVRIRKDFRTLDELIAYPGELRQVFSNLIGNALEAVREEGTIAIRARWAKDPDNANVEGVRVTIADNGSGVPLQARAQLFTPFFTTKGQKGTGLGLWVSKGLVEKHGGKISLRTTTRTPSGTAISVFLPAREKPVEILQSKSAEVA